MSNKKIALVTGGYSGEAVISYKSAETIFNNIDSGKWDCYLIDIHPSGWFYKSPSGEKSEVDKNDFSITVDGSKITFDAVLIGLHGTPGEDGKLQGYFDCLNIPYTSCDAATSALTFNKRYTVAVAAFAGIYVAKSMHLFKNDGTTAEQVLDQLKLPVFVKPNNGGSSLGMSKVTGPAQLPAALEKAFAVDEQVLVEEFIKGRELTIGVFRSKGKIIALPMTEIISKNEFFDFEAKYEGASEEITPAEVDEVVADKVRDAARKAYSVFNCRGIVRIDFIYEETVGQPYMLEINTVPGQSAASLVPQQVKAMGWSLKEFYSALIEEAFN
ncbi:D-alanine--D-alanine ligase [Ferruginibacter sp. HRS2-29]|uniref:D-alanine--D-alanine ligase n=1 Tax=Ferruginibacter sp. HRS2-29 TaxID=2487334 RepID=UPI0020CE3F34|nr:D-alanine--D-alanine ligase [Ferruginibacter sp. HRS2-29]MCP9749510.1 D-alanine--D-alanine ligase [Ferruginibacter sp. HRS2-29]